MKLPSGFDLSSLEVFMMTAELGGMTPTAQHFGMTQSAVSQTIAKLEASLKTKLFDRRVRPPALTASGRLLFREGARLLSTARGLVSEVRDGSELPLESVTIAMAESLANLLTAPLLTQLAPRAACWRIRSGISLIQHHEFVARKIDMLFTGSSQLEGIEDIVHHPILEEDFIIIAPATHLGPLDPTDTLGALPFVRFSLLSSMGQRIERQLARLRVRPPAFVEIDSTLQQLSAVAAGIGWSITTPLCLASHLALLDRVRVGPMCQGQFRRQVQLVARRGEFADLARDLAAHSRTILESGELMALQARLPWLTHGAICMHGQERTRAA
jgi:DNA-binding transcriptional LysR family regulator